ncbi:MAG: type I-C CRISPR-associated endonuclease Cas1c [Oscillospiraceae bacterium]|nr:type I-C CRISPR-associated endonuclease Cas1c [Oscillospiraceae bacterium]
MKKLLNTLYVLTPESYLFCRNENICIRIGEQEKLSVPALTIDSIVCFGKMTVSTPLLEYCGTHGISVTFVSDTGRFMGRFYGPVSGNVLLRKRQYDSMQDPGFCRQLVQSILLAKLRNSKLVLMRSARTAKNEDVKQALTQGVVQLSQAVESLLQCDDVDSMRGIEGAAASVYFSRFDDMLAGNPGGFRFETRSRRPPRNEVNAALSFTYMILTSQIQSAMETVGLDPAAGYLHTLRPGRASFALDLVEELRAPLCDRFVISLFNKGQLSSSDFEKDEEAVYLNEHGRRTLLSSWQRRKQEEITHPFLGEKMQIGMIPYVQSMLFARVLRGDLDYYPPFVWR